MNQNPKRSAIVRLVIVCLVIFAPDLSIEARFLLSGIFSALWAIEPLLQHWRRDKAVACVVAAAVMVAPLSLSAQEPPPPNRDGQEFTLLEGALAVAIVFFTGYGYYKCYVKGKKTTTTIGKKKARQIEETNPWPDDPTNSTNTIASKTSGPSLPTEYGAWFYEPLPAGDPTDCECRPMPVIEWVTPELGQVHPRFYFPANPIELGDYLANHGLTESTNSNFALNGEPSPDAPRVFTYTNRTLTFAIPGTVNRTSILQRSPDLERWETIFTTAAPARMVNNFADGTLADAGRQFYRVLVLP